MKLGKLAFAVAMALLGSAIFFEAPSKAADMPMADPAPSPEKNGIRLNDYAGFEDNWKLVTVHYRTDTAQIRFVYANPIAYETLLKGSTDYPDGAVFAKIAVASEDDPAFIDSKVPMGAIRDQFMVRDKTKFASTGGWGFALFVAPNPPKELFNTPPEPMPAGKMKEGTQKAKKQKSLPELDTPEACFACHQAVKSRGYVFSYPARLKFNMAAAPALTSPVMKFNDIKTTSLPDNIRSLLSNGAKNLRQLVPPTTMPDQLVYVGEYRPMLIHESKQTNLPAVFFSNEGASFILVAPLGKDHLPDGSSCPKGQVGFETHGSEQFTNIKRYFCH